METSMKATNILLLFFHFAMCCKGIESIKTSLQPIISNNGCSCGNQLSKNMYFSKYDTSLLLICGDILDTIAKDSFTVTHYKIINCRTGERIVDIGEDGIFNAIFVTKNKELLIIDKQFILDTNDIITSIPNNSTTIKIEKEGLNVSRKMIFSPPALTMKQDSSLNILCINLKQLTKLPRQPYPYDEKSIYLLYMGVLNKKKDATYILNNLDSLFVLDGAIAETKSELAISTSHTK